MLLLASVSLVPIHRTADARNLCASEERAVQDPTQQLQTTVGQRRSKATCSRYVRVLKVFLICVVVHYCLGIWLASASRGDDERSYVQSVEPSSFSTRKTNPMVVSACFVWTVEEDPSLLLEELAFWQYFMKRRNCRRGGKNKKGKRGKMAAGS